MQIPFSVNDILNLKNYGSFVVVRDGKEFVFELLGAFADADEPRQPHLDGRENCQIMRTTNTGIVRPLFPQDPSVGYSLGALSQDGNRLIILRHDRGMIDLLVFDFATDSLVEMDREIDIDLERGFSSPAWIDNRRIVYRKLEVPSVQTIANAERYSSDQISLLHSKQRNMVTVTATVLENPAAEGPVATDAMSVRVGDLNSGLRHIIARGSFSRILPSPNGRSIALSQRNEALSPAVRGMQESFPYHRRQNLLVVDVASGEAQVILDKRTDLYPGSLRWSADSRRLVFATRSLTQAGDAKTKVQEWEADSRQIHQYRLDGLRPLLESSARWGQAPKLLWANRSLAIRGVYGKTSKPGWWLASIGNEPRRWNDGILASANEIASADQRQILFAFGAGLDKVDATNGRVVSVFRSPPEAGGRVPEVVFPKEDIWFRATGQPEDGRSSRVLLVKAGDRYWIVIRDANGAYHQREISIDPSWENVFLMGSDVVGVVRSKNGFSLQRKILETGETKTLHEINRFLADRKLGETKSFFYRPAGSTNDSVGWLLMPPDYSPKEKYPVIVQAYPQQILSSSKSPFDISLDTLYPFASAGYIVLVPSVPIDAKQLRTGLMRHLAPPIEAAVQKLIDVGIADPARIHLSGLSWGGYLVYSVLATSNRFRSGIAYAGWGNHSSFYGQLDSRLMFDHYGAPGGFSHAGHLEKISYGVGGATPWEQPENYVNESPLFRADEIDAPLLIIQGDLDHVAFQQGEEMYTALARQNKRVKFMIFWGEGHFMPTSPANFREYWRAMLGWLNENGGSDPLGVAAVKKVELH